MIDVHQDAVAEHLGIGRTDLRCLDILDREGPLTAGALAEASGLSTGAITALIDRLERAGYAVRIRDSADRRRVVVAMTPRASQYANAAYGRLIGETNEFVERLTEEQAETVAIYMEEGARVVQENIAHVRAMASPPPFRG